MLIGMSRSLVFRLEDRRIAGHLRAVERLLRDRDTSGMPPELRGRRTEMLDRLAGYIRRGVYPRNSSSSFLTPVFVDSEGRNCAVAHLMSESVDSVGQISSTHNLARIREIPDPTLASWEARSGLDLDELALVQPQYANALNLALGAIPGMLVVMVGIAGACVSHAVRRVRFRFADTTPGPVVLVFAVVAAMAGWWLVGEARGAWALPDIGGSYSGALRDVAYGMVVWVLMAAGMVGVAFGSATVLRRVVASMSSWKSPVVEGDLVGFLGRGASMVIGACLAMIGPLVWAWAVTAVTQMISPDGICAGGRALGSQWLPLPHRRCLIDGQLSDSSYAETLFVVLALAPVVWVVARFLVRVAQPRHSSPGARHG